MSPFSACMLNNLSSPEVRGSVGTVAQEEFNNMKTPPTKTQIHIDLIVNLLLMEAFGRCP